MIKLLKSARKAEISDSNDMKVRATVEGIIGAVRERGDAAVREFSEKFDNWAPPSFRISEEQLQALVGSVSPETIEDIRFAQDQVRNFAQHQRAALVDIEVETLPGVFLGHKNIAVSSVGCYVPGGRYPMVASAHMSIVTAKVAGVGRIIACTPPTDGAPHAETIAAMVMAGADEIYLMGGSRRSPPWHLAPRPSLPWICWSALATHSLPRRSGSYTARSESTSLRALPRS